MPVRTRTRQRWQLIRSWEEKRREGGELGSIPDNYFYSLLCTSPAAHSPQSYPCNNGHFWSASVSVYFPSPAIVSGYEPLCVVRWLWVNSCFSFFFVPWYSLFLLPLSWALYLSPISSVSLSLSLFNLSYLWVWRFLSKVWSLSCWFWEKAVGRFFQVGMEVRIGCVTFDFRWVALIFSALFPLSIPFFHR